MTEKATLDADPDLAVESIVDKLAQLRQSDIFSRNQRLFALLEFLVSETLAGRGGSLKELVIGDALYSRNNPYDPRVNSSVRVEAHRLRRKLQEYYRDDGQDDTIRIVLPQGSYRPTFARIDPSGEPPATNISQADLAILPMRMLAGSEEHGHVGDGLTEEIIFAFEHGTPIRLAPRLLVFQLNNHIYTLQDAVRATHAKAFLCGTIRVSGSNVRATMELTNPLGFTLWSERFDGRLDDPFDLQEQLAGKIVARIPQHLLFDTLD